MPTKLPPGPRGPRLLNAVNFQRRPARLMDAARGRYGDVWLLRLPGTNFVMVSDPALLEQVFTADPAVLHTGSSTGKPVMGQRSLIILNEDEHVSMRKLLTPFFTPEAVGRYRGLAEQMSEREVANWPLNEPFPLLPRMETITLNMIMSAIFGVTEAAGQQKLRERINAIIAWGSNRVNMARLHASQRKGKAPPRSLPKARNPLDAEVYRVIQDARSDPRLEQRDDILAILLKARYEDGRPMTDDDLRDTLVTLLIQGHASTADGLCWAFERLMRTPEVYERLRAELEADGDAYLDAVIKETLRARPPLPIGTRMVNRPYELGGYEIELGTVIAPCIYLTHHRPDIYPEPERFRPERFLNQKPGKYTWIPFGGGDRSCLGANFAMRELTEVLRVLVQRTRLEPDVKRDEEIKLRRVGLSPSRQARAVLVERVPAPTRTAVGTTRPPT
jgi:cytochrome P450 family 135